jgi:hypothetical protein
MKQMPDRKTLRKEYLKRKARCYLVMGAYSVEN